MDRLELLFEDLKPMEAAHAESPLYLDPVSMKPRCKACHAFTMTEHHVVDCRRLTVQVCRRCGRTWPPLNKATLLASLNEPPE